MESEISSEVQEDSSGSPPEHGSEMTYTIIVHTAGEDGDKDDLF